MYGIVVAKPMKSYDLKSLECVLRISKYAVKIFKELEYPKNNYSINQKGIELNTRFICKSNIFNIFKRDFLFIDKIFFLLENYAKLSL